MNELGFIWRHCANILIGRRFPQENGEEAISPGFGGPVKVWALFLQGEDLIEV